MAECRSEPHVQADPGPGFAAPTGRYTRVMARSRHTVAAAAVVIGVASLVLANDVTSDSAHRGAIVALFLVFLVATLTLLAVSIASSSRIVDEQLAMATLRVRRRPIRTVAGLVRRGATTATGHSLAWVARTSNAGAVHARAVVSKTVDDLSRARTRQRRRELREPRGLRETLQQVGYATLVALGMPPEEDQVEPRPWMSQPLVRPRPAYVPGRRRVASYHPRTRTAARRQREAAARSQL
jgi:hypothetical protein